MPIVAPPDASDPVKSPAAPRNPRVPVTTRPAPRPVTNPPKPGYAWPTPATRLTSTHGAHHGIDVDGQSGDPVVAPAAGRVVFAGDASSSGYGGLVIIQDASGAKHYLAHLRRIDVQQGDVINPGDFLGEMGGGASDPMQGNSTGSHLHYEVRVGTAQVNPLQFFGGSVGQYGSIAVAPPANPGSYTGPGNPGGPVYAPGTPHDTSGSEPAPAEPPSIKLPTIKTPAGDFEFGEIPLPVVDWGRVALGVLGSALIVVGVLSLAGEEAIGAAASKLAGPIASAIEAGS